MDNRAGKAFNPDGLDEAHLPAFPPLFSGDKVMIVTAIVFLTALVAAMAIMKIPDPFFVAAFSVIWLGGIALMLKGPVARILRYRAARRERAPLYIAEVLTDKADPGTRSNGRSARDVLVSYTDGRGMRQEAVIDLNLASKDGFERGALVPILVHEGRVLAAGRPKPGSTPIAAGSPPSPASPQESPVQPAQEALAGPIDQRKPPSAARALKVATKILMVLVFVEVFAMFAITFATGGGHFSYSHGELVHNGVAVTDPVEASLFGLAFFLSFAIMPTIGLLFFSVVIRIALAGSRLSEGSDAGKGLVGLIEYQPGVVVFEDDADILWTRPSSADEFEASGLFEAGLRGHHPELREGANVAFEKVTGYPSGLAVRIFDISRDDAGNVAIRSVKAESHDIIKSFAGFDV